LWRRASRGPRSWEANIEGQHAGSPEPRNDVTKEKERRYRIRGLRRTDGGSEKGEKPRTVVPGGKKTTIKKGSQMLHFFRRTKRKDEEAEDDLQKKGKKKRPIRKGKTR